MYLPVPHQPFRLECAWLNAQAFRWREKEGWFYGIVGGHLIRVRERDGGLEFEGDAPAPAVEHYFRLDQDIEAIHDALCEADPVHMPRLIDDYGHIRVLRQDPWECLVAYICSRKAKVEDIRERLNKLADHYGDDLSFGDVTCRSIPSAQQLRKHPMPISDIPKWGLPSIANTLDVVAWDVPDTLSLCDLAKSRMPLAEASARLRKYDGIADKIAECVCLFSLGHDEAFPVDTHIGTAMVKSYGRITGTKNANWAGWPKWARKKFGPNAGYAGQLLFLDQWS